MKKYYYLLFFIVLSSAIWAQPAAFDCFRQNATLSQSTTSWVQQFQKIKYGILQEVQALIVQEGITQQVGVPQFQNLHSVVRTAAALAGQDSLYDDFFVRAATAIQQDFFSGNTCSLVLSPAELREQLTDYLEDEVFKVENNYASGFFATQVGFRSALQQINLQTDQWLALSGDELEGIDVQLQQPLLEDHYWRMLNENWDINIVNPEPELINAAQRFNAEGADKNSKLKDILLFIFDNWKDIKDILDWLNTNVFYDCHAVARASFKDKVPLETVMSPGTKRKINYQVVQRGVLLDGRETKTHLKGIARVYRKKWMGWGRDRLSRVGISYCTQQWNACENTPWPADGSTYMQAPNSQLYKTRLAQFHPFALTIKDRSTNFLTFDLHYNEQYLKSVYLFGNRPCYGN